MKKLTKARVKKIIELHEYFRNGLHKLSGTAVKAAHLRHDGNVWIADVTFSEWDEDGGDADVHCGWEYAEKDLRRMEAHLIKEQLLK